MARVTSQKTRQAILTVDSVWDPNLLPEKLALFDDEGNPITFSVIGANGIPNGGTEGQVLGKLSAADFDATWIDQTGGGGDDIDPEPFEFDTHADGDFVLYEGYIYEAEGDPTGWTPGDPDGTGGPPDYLDTYTAKSLTEVYQDAQVTTAEPVIPGSLKGGPVDLFAFKVGTIGTFAVRTTPRAGYDAYMNCRDQDAVSLAADDDGAGSAHPLVILNPTVWPAMAVDDIVYCMLQAYDGTGGSAKLSSIKVELSSGATLGEWTPGIPNPWTLIGVGGDIPAGGTIGQVLAKASDDDFAMEWVDAGGGGLVSAWRDDFTIDSFADYTAFSGMSFTGLDIDSGLLKITDANDHGMILDQVFPADRKVTMKMLLLDGNGFMSLFPKWVDANNHFMIEYIDASNTVNIYHKVGGGSYSSYGTLAIPSVVGPVWLVSIVEANVLMVEIHAVDPRWGGDPYSEDRFLLSTAIADLGTDIEGGIAIAPRGYSGGLTTTTSAIDYVKVETLADEV